MNKPTSQTSQEEPDSRTLLLIRRNLCAHSTPTTPLEELLPALSSSANVDTQLYAFIAIIIRDFVTSWYSHVSQDHTFTDEIVALIAHCTRSLEERMRKLDLEVLLLDEIPAILEAHVRDFRTASDRVSTALAPNLTLPELFRSYQPHPASDNERLYLKLLSNNILSVLLPSEDLESGCERSLLREIVANIILGNILDKLSEPFALYEIITSLLRPPNDVPPPPPSRRGSLAQTPPPPPPPPPKPEVPELPTLEHKIIAGIELLFTGMTALFSLLSSLHHLLLQPLEEQPKKRPLIRSALPGFISTLLHLSVLQPWLPATLRFMSNPFSTRRNQLGRLLDDLLLTKLDPLINEALVVSVLKTARSNLFPGDAMAPAKKYPSEEEKERIKMECEKAVRDRLPERVRKHWGEGVARRWLEVLGEKEVNKVLLLRVMDLLVSRLIPELTETGGEEWRKRRESKAAQMQAMQVEEE
ncbi:PXA domain-containing protein [Pyronema domesticum]|nr:PXA domain-containing protein [Pyronema domesticum]